MTQSTSKSAFLGVSSDVVPNGNGVNAVEKEKVEKPKEHEGFELSIDKLLRHRENIYSCKCSCMEAHRVVCRVGRYYLRATGPRSAPSRCAAPMPSGNISARASLRSFTLAVSGSVSNKDGIIAEWKGDAKPFLQQTLVSICPTHIHLNN